MIPDWFRGSDVVFEIISLFATFFIFFTARRIYKHTNDKQFKWFYYSFFMFFLSFLSKTFSYIVIYYPVVIKTTIHNLEIVSQKILVFNAYVIGINLSMIFMLVGSFMLIKTISKSKETLPYVFYSYFIAIIVFFSNVISENYRFVLFHITLIFIFIIISLSYLRKYNHKKNNNLLLLFLAFLFLAVSHIILVIFFPCFGTYGLSEIIQLIGFLFIFVTYLRVNMK